jgi:hypothetical protein
MKRYFTPTFYKFFFAFVAIIVVGFTIMVVGINKGLETQPVDNVANTQ